MPFPAGRAGHADAAGELPVPCECRHTASNRSQSGVCLKWLATPPAQLSSSLLLGGGV